MMTLQLTGMLFIFSLLMGLMNMLGGRFDQVDPSFPLDGRLVFRCLLPGVCAGALALALPLPSYDSIVALVSVIAGSVLWYAPGWSFDEISGNWSPDKYPALMRRFGLWVYPQINSPGQNRARGTLLKAIRGMYDILTFTALASINEYAPLLVLGCLMMGPIYRLCGHFAHAPAGQPVLDAEFCYGCWRGLLIGSAIIGGISWPGIL